LDLAELDFNFEAEFSLLDIGSTSCMLQSGGLRPTAIAYTANTGMEAICLDWEEQDGPELAIENARRYLRSLDPVAYAFTAHICQNEDGMTYLLPGSRVQSNEYLLLLMYCMDGIARGARYPIRRAGNHISFGLPLITDSESTEWAPLGDIWNNPFCVNDIVHFAGRERAVDPSTPLWQAIVELTRIRIHDDQQHSEEYMTFLDDLRNSVFQVASRSTVHPDHVILRPRTHYNPLGSLEVEASRLVLSSASQPDLERVTAS
jgi:hypothetical protein